MVMLLIAWVVMLVVFLVTKHPAARGIEALITCACVLWFCYWTLSVLLSRNGKAEEVKEETNATTKTKTKSPAKKQ